MGSATKARTKVKLRKISVFDAAVGVVIWKEVEETRNATLSVDYPLT